jgi:antitoxin component YwqK of YwqJK toxin-antitoxin module
MEKNKEIRKDNLINLFDENGERHGYWEQYYDNGQLSYKGNYVNGNKHGYWEDYFYNGQLNYKGNYVNGKPHGYWESYWDNGELDYKGFYDMGKEVSYNPNEPKVVELTLDEIAEKLNIPVEQLKIKK